MIRVIPVLICLALTGCNVGVATKPEVDQPKRICTHILNPDVKFVLDPNHEDTKVFRSFVGQSSITFRDEITGEIMTVTSQSEPDWRCKDYI